MHQAIAGVVWMVLEKLADELFAAARQSRNEAEFRRKLRGKTKLRIMHEARNAVIDAAKEKL